MDFHPFYSNPEQTAEKKDFYTNHTMMRFPHNIFTQDTTRINAVSHSFAEKIERIVHIS